MRTWALAMTIGLLVATAERSLAGPAVAHAQVTRSDDEPAPGSTDPTSRATELASPCDRIVPCRRLRASLHLALPTALRASTLDLAFDLDRPIAFALPELPPEDLRLEAPLLDVATFYVTADLDAELPRLDAVDGETYFMPGIEAPLAGGVRAFLEDFQPASGVVGGADVDGPAAARSWDGHQVAAGLRWAPTPRVQLEAAAVAHVLSATRRPSTLGAMASVSIAW